MSTVTQNKPPLQYFVIKALDQSKFYGLLNELDRVVRFISLVRSEKTYSAFQENTPPHLIN